MAALILAGAALVLAQQARAQLRSDTSTLSVATVAHSSGLLARYGVVIMLVLMSRAPGLERGMGADVLSRWHARGGRILFGLVCLHAAAAIDAYSVRTGRSRLGSARAVLDLPHLLIATIGTGLLLLVGVTSSRRARRRLRYELWHGLHLLTYAAVALAFLHQLAGPDLTGYRGAQLAWSLLYAYAFALLIYYRVIVPVQQARRHQLRVAALVPEGPGVVSVVLRGTAVRDMAAEPGQFFRWRFLTPQTWMSAHPFSLSAPLRGDDVRITVKALGDGSTLIQAIGVGTRVLAEGPYGALTASRRSRPAVLLIAGGVGIAPMRTLFETLPVDGPRLTLLYRARDETQVLFRRELDELASRRGARLHYLLGPAGGPEDHLSPASLLYLVPDVAERDVFFCGSAALSRGVRAGLRGAGVPRRQIHEERFAL